MSTPLEAKTERIITTYTSMNTSGLTHVVHQSYTLTLVTAHDIVCTVVHTFPHASFHLHSKALSDQNRSATGESPGETDSCTILKNTPSQTNFSLATGECKVKADSCTFKKKGLLRTKQLDHERKQKEDRLMSLQEKTRPLKPTSAWPRRKQGEHRLM